MIDMLIFKKLGDVSKELKSVAMVKMERYKARHIYDVYNMVQPIFAKNGIVLGRELHSEQSKEVQSAKGTKGVHRFQVWKFNFYAEDGSCFSTMFGAESIDWGDKCSSQCDAMAFKQCLIHTFLIPTQDMQEPDDKKEETNIIKKPTDPGEYVVKNGKNKGVMLKNVSEKDMLAFIEYADQAKSGGAPMNKSLYEDADVMAMYLEI